MLASAVAACRLRHTPEQRAHATMRCARARALWGGHRCAQALICQQPSHVQAARAPPCNNQEQDAAAAATRRVALAGVARGLGRLLNVRILLRF